MQIFVRETTILKNGEHKDVEGTMNEEKFSKLYFPESLRYLKTKGQMGDAIGQGRYMFAKIIED